MINFYHTNSYDNIFQSRASVILPFSPLQGFRPVALDLDLTIDFYHTDNKGSKLKQGLNFIFFPFPPGPQTSSLDLDRMINLVFHNTTMVICFKSRALIIFSFSPLPDLKPVALTIIERST